MDEVKRYLNSLDLEVREWLEMTPEQRWKESMRLWDYYLTIGGSLDPEPDFQSPFFDPETWSKVPGNGRAGLRFIRRF